MIRRQRFPMVLWLRQIRPAMLALACAATATLPGESSAETATPKPGDPPARPVQQLQEANAPASIKLISLIAQQARLTAERDAGGRIAFPAGFERTSPAARLFADSQRRLFEARRALADNQKGQLRQRIGQFEDEGRAFEAQRKAKAREVALVKQELALMDKLRQKQLANERRIMELERDLARFEGEEASLAANVERTRRQVNEAKLQLAAIDQNAKIDAERELQTVEMEMAAFAERDIERTIETEPAHQSRLHDAASVHAPAAAPGFWPPATPPGPQGKARNAKQRRITPRRSVARSPVRSLARGLVRTVFRPF